ncbi:MFS transporter [Halovenus sp. WSH3]|uniref:MFS transporter n=1 Tax=Halovenus carboxidivorans TaxID=2692199 RepID=A0A6B0T0A1_9EURY|nr:MFS transporter [Halovenus carboxidivorans]MXR51578.1 MFS transporter [Halovenus carboxidivorans]
MISGKWKNLILATLMFYLGFTIWFSFAPYTGEIADEFGLSVAELGIVASAAIIAVPLGRIVIGPLTDKYGAPTTVFWTMLIVGGAAITSAFTQTYEVFIAARIVASLAGITFVIGIAHVSEWFDEENLGLAEGIYAGIGNAGAGLGSLLILPTLFGAGYSGPLFDTNWRAAFFYTGAAAIVTGVVYYFAAEAARSEEKRQATKEGVTVEKWLWVATRYGAVVLAVAYVMTFGLELAMNGWLSTYYREAFGEGRLRIAAGFAATFSIAAGLLRPIGGYMSDVFQREEWDVISRFEGEHRNQWTFIALTYVVISMFVMTLAGLTGNIIVAVVAAFGVGLGCAFAEGAIFAQVPSMFPDDSGSVAGIVGGIGSSGGVFYPLIFSSALLPNLHLGYAVAAVTMIPILVLAAWVFQPHISEVATEKGWLVTDERPDSTTTVTADD